MELQLSLDMVTLEEAKRYLAEAGGSIDIIEVGTPFILQDGLRAVREIRKDFPQHAILADLKIMDAGEHEAKMAFDAGADIVTVLGVSDDTTVRGAIKAARACGKAVMVDMICVRDIADRALEMESFGADYVCVHTAFDIQSEENNPLAELRIIKKVLKKAKIAVAGGIKLETLGGIVAEKPDVVIIGGGITGKQDKKAAAQAIKNMLK
jgi:3-hexulose-6-phosphate synthase